MKNYYYDLVQFRKALSRNHVQKVFLNNGEFWFYTRKGVISHKSDDVSKLYVWLVTVVGIEVDKRS